MTHYDTPGHRRACAKFTARLRELRPLMAARGWRWNGYGWVPAATPGWAQRRSAA